MSLFSRYFNKTVGVHRIETINSCGDTDYIPPLTAKPEQIKCRIEYKFKEILDRNGNKAISEATIYSDKQLRPLDIIIADGQRYTVKSCEPIYGLDGTLDHYEIYL